MKKLLYSFITISLLFGNSFAWGQENFLLMDYGNLYNLETGEKVWEIKDFYYSIYNKYVIDNNLIILGSNVISSKDLKSGIEKYSNKLNSSIEASIPPAYDEKTKLFVSYFFDRVEKKFNFISFDITGKEIWRIPFPSDYRRLSNGSIIDDTRDVLGIISQNGICYCLTDGTNEGLKLQAIDINNKSVKWTNIVDSLSYRTTRGNSLLQFRGDNIFINYPQNKEGYASLGLEISPNGNILNNLDCYPSIQKVDIDDYFIVGKRFGFFKFYGKLVCYDFENKKINWISPASGYITSKYSFSEKTNSILCTYVDEKNKASILSIDINTGTIKWQREMGVWGGQPVSIVPYEDKIAIFINRSLPVLAKIKIIKFDNPDNILKTFEVAGGSFNYIERIISFGTSPTQTLTLSATTQNALATASNANITLNTNNNWTASSNAPWLKVSPTSGNAGANLAVNFTIDANTTANARTGIVTFTAGALTQTYTVTQAGAIAPVLTISATAQNVVATANATGSSITLTANNTWTASSNVAWLKVNPASGNAGTNLAVNFPIEANTATTTRTGIVTFTSGGLTQTYTVTQAGTVTPTLTISVAAQNIGANATTSNLTLTANNSWTASSNSTWLKASPTSGNAGTNLAVNFTIDSNNSTVERTGIITFTAGGLTKTYTVTQAGTVAPILTISVSSQNVVSTASTTNITLTSNNTWTASSNATWLKVSPANGNNGANLTINFTIDANTTANARTGIVTFTAGGLTQTYTVTQAGMVSVNLTLSITAQNVVAAANATGSAITLTANNTWTASSNVAWLKVNPASGNAGTNLAVNFPIEANTATTTRTGIITFTSGGLTQTYTVTQAGTVTPTLTISVAAQNVGANATTSNLTLTANNSWTASSNASWLKVSPTSGNAGTNLAVNFTIDSNNSTVERTGIITFTAGGLTKTYTVTQAGTVAPILTISVSSQNVVSTASTTNITLTSNNTWTASSNATWLKVSPAIGNNGANLTINFTIDANTTANARTGIVSFVAGGLTQTYTVTQAGQAPLTFTFLQPLGNQQVLPKSILSVKGTGEWANEISFSIGIYEKATSKLIQQLSTNTSTQQLKDGINYTLNDLAPAQYDLKVQGNNQKTLIGSVVIEIVNNASTIDLLWDYETNRTLSNKKPLGVAADGTARLLLKITPNATVASRVKKITAELQNPTNSTIISSSYLGKIMATNKTNNTYSDEASNITTTSASNIFTTTDNSYYFWYVAPDDFADKIIDDLVNGERKVRCKITLYDAANTVLNSAEPTITVVRPPLALVHGLGGDPTSYDNFGYGATSASILFKDDTRFKTRKALKVYPNDTFEANANLLLGKDNTNMDNSLPYLINDLRAKGYACNRVDYVGHSMGGCMLRYATQLNDWKSNLNYNKGYVNKFVTLDTPHQGSPLGDIVNEFAPFIPIENEKLYSLATLMGKVSSFITANNFSQIATPAVQNLSLRESNGGIKLKETEIKNHEIIGDYVKDFNPPHLALVTGGDISGTLVGLPILANALSDGAIKKFKQCANCVAEYNAVQEMKSYALTDYHFTKEFLNWQAKRVAGLNNFFQSSDIIVSTESQSAGLLSQKLPSQTVVMASHSFGKSSVLSSSQAGNKVNSLLNATISSNLFADVIPATKSITTPYSCGTSDCKTANNRLAYVQLDTTKIKIISPLRGGITLAAGSNLTIQVQLKDTTGYRFLEVNMGLLRQRTNEKKGIVSITIQVPSDIIGKQYLSVKGVYRDKNGNYQEYEDNVNLTVQTIEQPQAVQVIPTSLKLNVGKSDTLKFVATYAKSQSLWLAPYNNITAEYDNALLSIDTKTMTITGKKAGKTTIILTISNGNKYNVAVEIIQPPIILATEPIANNQENQVIIFPNPTTNEVTVKYRLQTAAFVKIELFDLQGHLLNGLFDGKQNVNEYNLKIDFSKYPVGEYLLKFQIGEEKISKKVIKL